jgi:hypothetical protein
MTQRDIKVLWGRAAGLCSICRRKLTQDEAHASDAFPLGEHAHIVGEKPGSARYESPLTADERDGYANRILLCPNDHTVVDKAPADWPVERLHMKKVEHELWVEQTLATKQTAQEQADNLIYSTVMDSAIERLELEDFNAWASSVLEPYWRWRGSVYSGIARFREQVFVTDWPGTVPELEIALDRASFELQEATDHFAQYSELRDDDFIARRRYKERLQPPDVYEKLDSRFWLWSDLLEQRIVEAAKALNWARETWRREMNPAWLATQGVFSLTMHPGLVKPSYTPEEKAELLAAGLDRGDIRRPIARQS